MEAKFTLYDLLGVPKEASRADITKAYRLMALKLHPDKNPDDAENAQKNFQKLNEAYGILLDPKKREIYDRTGETEANDSYFEAYEYFRAVYTRISNDDIDSFAARYKDSPEEVEDLIRFYEQQDGDMKDVLYYIPLSEKKDLTRFWRILDELISAKKLPKKKKYETSKKRVKDLKDECIEIVEPESPKGKKGKNNIMALVQKIKGKQTKDPEEFFKYLEEKYNDKPVKKRKVNK